MISAPVGQRCPECARPTGRSKVITAHDIRAQNTGWRSAPFTYSVIGICAAVFLAMRAPGLNDAVFGVMAQINHVVANDNQLWRLLTSAFLHLQLWHIGFNMFALYIFGPPLERAVGSASFASLYVASALVGSTATLFIAGPGVVAYGASGAVFGLFGAWLASAARNRHTLQGRANLQSLGILLGINLLMPLVIPNIGWHAHLGGLIAGAVTMWLWFTVGMDRTSAPKRIGVAALVGVLAFVLAVFA